MKCHSLFSGEKLEENKTPKKLITLTSAELAYQQKPPCLVDQARELDTLLLEVLV